MDYKQCCTECQFHFFKEDECPACEAYEIALECEQEWKAELSAISVVCGFEISEKLFDKLWYNDLYKWIKIVAMQVAPEIHDWYTSIDNKMDGFLYEPPQQIELFEPELPF